MNPTENNKGYLLIEMLISFGLLAIASFSALTIFASDKSAEIYLYEKYWAQMVILDAAEELSVLPQNPNCNNTSSSSVIGCFRRGEKLFRCFNKDKIHIPCYIFNPYRIENPDIAFSVDYIKTNDQPIKGMDTIDLVVSKAGLAFSSIGMRLYR